MGNLCSVVLRGISYLLRLIFPKYTTVLLEGYNPISEEQDHSALSNNISSAPEITDSLSNPVYGIVNGADEPEENEDQTSPGEDNTEYIRSIVNNFFDVHNLQKEALTKNITDKFLDLYGKVNNDSSAKIITENTGEIEIRDSSGSVERQNLHTINKALSSFEKVLKESTVNQEYKTCAYNASLKTEDKENDSYLANKIGNVDITECGIGKCLTERAKINIKGIENPKYRQKKYGMVLPGETLRDQKELSGNLACFLKENLINEHSNDGHKISRVPSKEVVQDQKMPCENFPSSDKEISPNDDSDDEYIIDVEVCKRKKLCLRKISLNNLYSGSHYFAINNDENVELLDYSMECPPIMVEDGICYRKFRSPNLSSGGTVAFQELSDHLSIPNWYKENPIVYEEDTSVYHEIPKGVKSPYFSQVKLQQAKSFTCSTSSSGGGIISEASSRKVCLPDLFPSSPLPQTYSPLLNTQSSASFGEIKTPTDQTKEIFTELLKESIAHDATLTWKISEEEMCKR